MSSFPKHLAFASLLATFLCASTIHAQAPAAVDSDHDGLSDQFEQELLQRFQPELMISATDCAGKPARFKRDHATPKIEAKDGTIYGQVLPVSPGRVEIHYYTLWGRDCGRVGHPLDAEHVAALVSLDGAQPTALYWYAGAHEKTFCDISSGARASALHAENHGPKVWSSAGKHALYFSKAKCDSGSGCGTDSCADDVELPASQTVINIGERTAPANGSPWVNSPSWVLRDKMAANFSPELINLVNAAPAGSVITVRGRNTLRGTIQVSDTVLGSATSGAQDTSAALDTADTHATKSLQKAADATGHALRKSWNAVFHSKSNSPPK